MYGEFEALVIPNESSMSSFLRCFVQPGFVGKQYNCGNGICTYDEKCSSKCSSLYHGYLHVIKKNNPFLTDYFVCHKLKAKRAKHNIMFGVVFVPYKTKGCCTIEI